MRGMGQMLFQAAYYGRHGIVFTYMNLRQPENNVEQQAHNARAVFQAA